MEVRSATKVLTVTMIRQKVNAVLHGTNGRVCNEVFADQVAKFEISVKNLQRAGSVKSPVKIAQVLDHITRHCARAPPPLPFRNPVLLSPHYLHIQNFKR